MNSLSALIPQFGYWTVALAMFSIAFFIGTVNSLLALFMDESFGYFTRLHNTYGRVYWARVGYSF